MKELYDNNADTIVLSISLLVSSLQQMQRLVVDATSLFRFSA